MNAIVVQCYNKADTTAQTLLALMECEKADLFDLVIWQDSEIGNGKAPIHAPQRQGTTDLVNALLPMLERVFKSVEFKQNESNLGCYETCRLSIDYAFRDHEYVIFVEDDGVFSKDALNWFLAARNFKEFSDPACRAVTGESIYFNSGNVVAPRKFRQKIIEGANKTTIGLDYITLNFVTSTVFAVDAEKWNKIREVRGQINGDVTLCEICREENLFCIFPIVPRVDDIGMRHAQGYSVGIHAAENVSDKNTYMTSDDLVLYEGEFKPYTASKGRLYDLTANLNEAQPPIEEIYAIIE